MSTNEMWIYHERQEAMLCGQHALNNLVQACVYSPDKLAEIAQQLDEMELAYMAQNNEGGVRSKEYLQRLNEGSGNVDPQGNFSIQVLRSALLNEYNLSLPNIRQEGIGDSMEITEMEGFICNRNAHWFAIRKINGRFWNLNSTLERPQVISHFRLAAEMQALQDAGYSVFCVVKGLPAPCTSIAGTKRGLPQYWWKEEDLVRGKSNAMTVATDPWKDVGSGMRLDGRPAQTSGASIYTDSFGDLTEHEMMQFALAASLETAISHMPPAPTESKKIEVPPEPATDASGAVRIQFRMPDGSRKIRRFLSTDCVETVYGYVEEETRSEQGKHLELRYGFPPKDLSTQRGKTIAEARLAGDCIQSRYV